MGSLLDLAGQIEDRTPAQQAMVEDGLPPAAIVPPEERSAAWAKKGVAPKKCAAITPSMKKQHPAEIAAEEAMTEDVRHADHFLASLFKGTGVYEKAQATTVALAIAEGKKLENLARGTQRCMIYAVGHDGRATLLTAAFITRMMGLAKSIQQEPNMKAEKKTTKADQVAGLRAKRAATKDNRQTDTPPPKKAAKAKARTPVGERARYDWAGAEAKAEAGTIPPKPDFSAPTHARFLPIMAEITKACADRDTKALKAIEINPNSSTPKAMDRYRGLCAKAIAAKA